MNFGANLRISRCGWFTIILVIFLIVYMWSDSSPASTDELVNIKALLRASIRAAERGGAAAVAAKKSLIIDSKGKTLEGANDPVTSADMASHCAMVGVLRAAFPQVHVMSEESDRGSCEAEAGGDQQSRDDVELLYDEFVYADDVTVWMDPLDATQEYTEGLDEFVTTMVCVAIKGVPVVGVIHFPFSRKTSWGWFTKRASSDLQPLSYNAERRVAPRVIVSRSHPGDVDRFVHGALGPAAVITHAGGAGYKVMSVATLDADLYVHTTAIKKWDICAGNAIINTLGGNLTTLSGNTVSYSFDSDVKNSEGLLVTRFDHDYYLGLIKNEKSKPEAG